MSKSNIRLKPVVRYTMQAVGESHSTTALRTRDLLDVSDEPLERGGTNEGFAPTEFVLGGLAACTNVISHKIAHANNIAIQSMEIDVKADFNRMGVNLQEHVRVPFPKIELIIRVVSDATPEQEEILKTDLPKYCAVSNIIRESGTEIVENWQFSAA